MPGVPVVTAAAGDVIGVGEVRFEVLWPLQREAEPGEDRNDLSLVLRLEVDGVRFLLTGDVEPEAQRAILRSGVDLRTDVLKVPHHGSARQDEAWLASLEAELALVSVGADNDFANVATRGPGPVAGTLALILVFGLVVACVYWGLDRVLVRRRGTGPR